MEFLRYQPTPVPFLGLTLVQWLCIAAVFGFGWRLVMDRRAARAASVVGSALTFGAEK